MTISAVIDVKMDGSILEVISFFKVLELSLFSNLDWGSFINSTATTVTKKIGTLIHSMKFLSSEFALYL